MHGGSPLDPTVGDGRAGVTGNVTAGRLNVVGGEVRELGSVPVVRLVPVPIMLGDDPNPADGAVVVPSGGDKLDVPDMLDVAGALGDRPDENARLDGADPIEPVPGDDVAVDEVLRLDVVTLEPGANVPAVGDVTLLVEVGAPNVLLEMVGSQGAGDVGAAPVDPVCIDVDG